MAAIGVGVLLGGSIAFTPNFPIILGGIMKIIQEIKEAKNKPITENKVKRVLKNLEKKEIIGMVEKDGEIFVQLKDNGNILIAKYSLKILLDFKKQRKKWNNKWFMVVFDVPEMQRNKRDYLRCFLREIGFYRYQQSVYAFPFDCEKEIALIKRIVEGGKYISYIIAEKIENESELRTYFQL